MWRITILGYYGQKNTGDDALAVTVLRGIGQHMAQAHFYIHADPLVVPSGFRVSFAPSGWAVKIRGLRRLSLIFRSMYWADIVVLGGGSVIHDLLGPSHLMAKVRFFKHLKVLGKKLAAVGLGIGPLRTPQGKAAARDLLKLFDFVAVRDKRSLEEARSISAPVTKVAFDPAVLLEKAGLPEWRDDPYLTKDPHRPIFGISVCDFHRFLGHGESADRKRFQKLVRALQNVKWGETEVWLFEFNGHPLYGDMPLLRNLQVALKNRIHCKIVPYSPNPLIMLRRLKQCRAVLAMRLHAAVYSFASGVPFVVLSYHPKCSAFAQMVGLPLEAQLDSEKFKWQELVDKIDALLSNDKFGVPSLSIAEAQVLAERNFEWFAKLAGGGLE